MGIFGKTDLPAPPPPPKPVRQPVLNEQEVAAAERAKRARRRGRQSTVLSDATKQTVGSSGQKLGA